MIRNRTPLPSASFWLLAVLSTCVLTACARLGRMEDFVPTSVATEADFDTIAEYAAYAAAAYLPEEEIRKRYPGTVRVKAPAGTETLYFLEVLESSKVQTISVRGTKTLGDVLHDIEFTIVRAVGLDITIHRGFQEDALLIYEDVKPFLRKDFSTRVTGHSLGAAVSAILMIYLQRDGYAVERSVNFGQPKFTNAQGAERYKDLPLQRVVDANDVVPMLPPPFALHPKHGAYAHTGEEIILLDGRGYVRLNQHDSERISVGQFWRDLKLLSSDDHRMTNYIRRIESKRTSAKETNYLDWKSSKHSKPMEAGAKRAD